MCTAHRAFVASYNDHHGEEPCLSGDQGSGTIFFGSCNLRCAFCQNFPLSHFRSGRKQPIRQAGNVFYRGGTCLGRTPQAGFQSARNCLLSDKRWY